MLHVDKVSPMPACECVYGLVTDHTYVAAFAAFDDEVADSELARPPPATAANFMASVVSSHLPCRAAPLAAIVLWRRLLALQATLDCCSLLFLLDL